jgi:hypothetical protein
VTFGREGYLLARDCQPRSCWGAFVLAGFVLAAFVLGRQESGDPTTPVQHVPARQIKPTRTAESADPFGWSGGYPAFPAGTLFAPHSLNPA